MRDMSLDLVYGRRKLVASILLTRIPVLESMWKEFILFYEYKSGVWHVYFSKQITPNSTHQHVIVLFAS